jgi:hypothetical protein
MARVPIDQLSETKFREIETQTGLVAARVDGWLVWEVDGTVSYVDPDEFERDFERSPP